MPPNNSFKPSPLRGLGQTGSPRAGRLNSGVRPYGGILASAVSPTRIALLSLLVLLAVGVFVLWHFQKKRLPPVPDTASCEPIPKNMTLGPAQAIAQVEQVSLAKMKASPSAPQVPFGYNNYQWLALKALVKPGDTIHAYETLGTGGYILVRGTCSPSRINVWIR
jgi:hypothetical protein